MDRVHVNCSIGKEQIEKTLKCLIDNGIDKDEAETVLQAIGYTLLNAELSVFLPNA